MFYSFSRGGRRSRCGCHQVDVSAPDELRFRDAELRHHLTRDRVPTLGGFAIAKNEFQLHEGAQFLDPVEGDSGALSAVEAPHPLPATPPSEAPGQGLAQ